jgi:predicted dehydrogenase
MRVSGTTTCARWRLLLALTLLIRPRGSERVRAAIIGTGGIAKVHVRLIRELGGELVGVCGRTLDSARSFATAVAYDDVTRMLREQKPDVVHVCSPNHLHAEHSIAAFESGAHVLCEKPMATNTDECRRMIDAAAKAGRIGAVAYTYRGYPLVEILRRKVADGEFGVLRRIGGCYLSQDVLPADKYVWLFTPGTTGRSYALMDLGIHWLDLVEYVTGARIHEITAQFSTHQQERIWRGGAGEGPRPLGSPTGDGGIRVGMTLEEQADLLIRLDNGAAGALTVSGLAPGHPNTIVLSADGPTGGFDWNQQEPNTYLHRTAAGNTLVQRRPEDLPDEAAWMSTLPAGHAEGYLDAFRNVVYRAWSAMQGKSMCFPSFSDGARGVRLVEAAIQSAADRRTVIVDD